jgi:uncharacterized protein (UPF0276 family)
MTASMSRASASSADIPAPSLQAPSLPAPSLPALGVGITYSAAIEPLLERRPELFPVVEIEPQTTWIKTSGADAKYRVKDDVLAHLRALPGRKLIHSVGTPVGGSVRPEPAQLALLQEAVRAFNSPWASDHLSFNQTPDYATGFFLPPRQTLEGVEIARRDIHDLQAALSVPVAVETGVNYLKLRKDELPDGEFVRRVVEAAQCGVLLDLHNIFTNALNGRQSVDEFLERIPLDLVWEVHLAGGMELDGFWLDAHSGAIPDALYAIAERVIPRLPNLGAIIFEIFPSFVPEVGLDLVAEQMQRLHALWALRRRSDDVHAVSPPLAVSSPAVNGGAASPQAWEQALGAVVTGRPPEHQIGRELRGDPGTGVIRGLIQEFRASMIVGTLRLTSRLLMLALGTDAFRTILQDYWSKVPPQSYGSLEAEAFGNYLRALDLKVPHLAKILEFEQAALATLTDDVTRIVKFDFEPLPLLRALAEGRLPDLVGEVGAYEIELTADGATDVANLGVERLPDTIPFH